MFDTILCNEGNKFYSIKADVTIKAQEELGFEFPEELKELYKQVGYGFLYSEEENFNRIMDPKNVCDFRFRRGMYSDEANLEIYEDYEKSSLVFFEICEGSYLSIGFSKDNMGEIFYGKVKIANSLVEFLRKYQEDERYFM